MRANYIKKNQSNMLNNIFLRNPPTTLTNKNHSHTEQRVLPCSRSGAQLIGEVARRAGGVRKVLRVESIVLRDIFHSALTALR